MFVYLDIKILKIYDEADILALFTERNIHAMSKFSPWSEQRKVTRKGKSHVDIRIG